MSFELTEKKYDPTKDLLQVRKCLASTKVNFATKNKFTSNTCNL